jgi:predicted alpha-1,2-mannosidase
VGISFVSVAKARASVEREIGPKSFDEVKSLAQEKWEAMLSRIQVAGGTEEQLKLFYSLFSRLLCMPTDLGCDDEFGSWHSGVRHFTDFCCVWDNVRTACALTALFDPSKHIDQLNCLLDVAEKTGWLPDVWIAGHSACVQGGSSADILFCEAAGKELPGIDYEKALRYMRKNNEVDPPDPYFYGRYLKDYHELGYVSTDVRLSCVSRHLEYAYQDWCIGALADKLGHLELARQYRENSRKVWNLWREDIRQFAPRVRGGDWVQPFDPAYHLPDRWNDPYFYEGNSWQWSFNVHHDFAGLVQRHGSAEGFCRHLDAFFDGGLYESKETMLHVPYLYHYAGRPDRTAQRVRKVREAYFAPTRNGLKDNEDMGCQSSFYIWSSIGVFPIMGQDIYLLNSPVFEETVIRMGESGKSIKIKAEFESPNARYVAAVQVNGKSQDRSWIRHAEIAGGGEISFRVSDQPGEWGRHDVPPSPMSSTA